LLAVSSADWQGAILLAWTSGMRLSDSAGLRWKSLDLEYGVISFRQGKTGAELILAIHEDFADWLTRQPSPEKNQEFVFPSLAGRKPNGPNGLSTEFASMMEKAKIRNRLIRQESKGKGRDVRALSFHSFRHSAATQVFAGAALKEITKRITGHSGDVVARYIHSDLQALREATKLIPRLPKGPIE
jgi:integrase